MSAWVKIMSGSVKSVGSDVEWQHPKYGTSHRILWVITAGRVLSSPGKRQRSMTQWEFPSPTSVGLHNLELTSSRSVNRCRSGGARQ